ncbi:hypothetical protein [Fusobacterium polymorphum]|uniref:Uncharacterized protein n=1 Tax=Fusobacterium nucleatum subsp. polymorphum TaxID=76857 RepID=A0A2C6BM09_FUSNP|nr:hypothetical protein [Fusobacterium polymorphum]PHI06648.1 hypothetical protein CBG54_06170 [Fusobacterium polymorphum]
MKYSYFEAKRREMKCINIFSRKKNYAFEVEFKNLNNEFYGTETIEKTITNKKTLIKNINSIKEKMLKKLEITEYEDIVFCYRYFNFYPKHYTRNIKFLIIIPIIKLKENYYKTNAFFNEFEYKKEGEMFYEYYDFDELQDIIQKYKYKKFDAEKIASEIVFDLIDDSNMALWNYEIENIDKGMDFKFYE